MSDLLLSALPAVAALSGVVVTQTWTTRNDRRRERQAAVSAALSERKSCLLRFVVSANAAHDSARAAHAEGLTLEEARRRDPRGESPWAQMYERYLEVSLAYPPEAAKLVRDHIDKIWVWRKALLAGPGWTGTGSDTAPPRHEDLIEQLAPWYSDPRLPPR